MENARVFLGLVWFLAGAAATEIANDHFIVLAYRWGAIVSMGLAFLAGWFWASIGYRLLALKHQKAALGLSLAVLVPLLCLKGYPGIAAVRSAVSDPDSYSLHGVGPVDQVALLAQAGGILLAGLMHWRSLRQAKRLPDGIFAEE